MTKILVKFVRKSLTKDQKVDINDDKLVKFVRKSLTKDQKVDINDDKSFIHSILNLFFLWNTLEGFDTDWWIKFESIVKMFLLSRTRLITFGKRSLHYNSDLIDIIWSKT